MLVVMQSRATADEIRKICESIEAMGFRAHTVEGADVLLHPTEKWKKLPLDVPGEAFKLNENFYVKSMKVTHP